MQLFLISKIINKRFHKIKLNKLHCKILIINKDQNNHYIIKQIINNRNLLIIL